MPSFYQGSRAVKPACWWPKVVHKQDHTGLSALIAVGVQLYDAQRSIPHVLCRFAQSDFFRDQLHRVLRTDPHLAAHTGPSAETLLHVAVQHDDGETAQMLINVFHMVVDVRALTLAPSVGMLKVLCQWYEADAGSVQHVLLGLLEREDDQEELVEWFVSRYSMPVHILTAAANLAATSGQSGCMRKLMARGIVPTGQGYDNTMQNEIAKAKRKYIRQTIRQDTPLYKEIQDLIMNFYE